MRITRCLSEALRGIAAHKLRYLLVSSGQVISIAAIVALLTIGNGIDAVLVISSTTLEVVQQLTWGFSVLRTTLLAVMSASFVIGLISLIEALLSRVARQQETIALFKVVGADSSDISFIYLAQAVIIALLAGIIGIVLGFVLAYALAPLLIGDVTQGLGAAFLPVTPVFSYEVIVLPLVISIVFGIMAGLFPAYRAANINPLLVLPRSF